MYSHTMRNTIITSGLIGLIVLAIATPGRAQMPPTMVETDAVKTMTFRDQVTLVGRTEARSSSRIVAEVSGRVVRIDTPEGLAVNQGAVLVSVDAARAQIALDAKKAEVIQAKAQAELAEKELKRQQDLFRQKLISDGGMDQASAEATRSEAWYQQKLAEERRLALDLQQCRIRAPFSGYTVRQLVNIGEWVNPGTPVYTVVDLRDIKVIVELPERHFGRLAIGSTVAIRISGEDGFITQGKVSGIAPSAGEETHTFPVIVTVPNEDGRLGGGMLVRATLSFKQEFESFAVSKDAIIRQRGQTMVYTIADGKAAPVMVRTSSESGNWVAISGEGLAEGMQVVVRGNERIFPGAPVRTADAPPAGGETSGGAQ